LDLLKKEFKDLIAILPPGVRVFHQPYCNSIGEIAFAKESARRKWASMLMMQVAILMFRK
jgi:hypothetical protein